MDLSTYKILHALGLMTLFFAFGGLVLGAWTHEGRQFLHRRLYILLHGIGLVIVLVSGFGQLARLGITGGLPAWVIVKLVVWVLFGVVLSLILRAPQLNKFLWAVLLILGACAAYLGISKPF